MDIATAFGVAAVVINASWPLLHRRPHLLLGQTTGSWLMGAHYALLDISTGAVLMTVAGTVAAAAIPLEDMPHFRRVYLASLCAIPVVCFVSWRGPPSAISSVALALVCIGNFQINETRLRLWLAAAIATWFVHNVVVGSVPGIASTTCAFAGMLWQHRAASHRLTLTRHSQSTRMRSRTRI